MFFYAGNPVSLFAFCPELKYIICLNIKEITVKELFPNEDV